MFEGLQSGQGSIDREGDGISRPSAPDWPEAAAGGDRLEQIVEAANHVAARIRDEAEAQARRYVEDARRRAEALTSERIRSISEASDALLEQGRTMKVQTDQLVEALRDAAARIGTASADVEPPRDPVARPAPRERNRPARADESLLAEVDARRARARATEETALAEAGPGSTAPAEIPGATEVNPDSPAPASRIGRATSEEPRLLATRMAVAGSSPRQVETRLREVGVEDPVGLVNAVFSDV